MRRALAWARWEFNRDIEVTPVIRFITFERFVKGALLVAGGVILIILSNRGNALSQLAENLQTELNLDPGRGFFHEIYARTVIQFGNYSRLKEDAVAVGAILYGVLEGLEGAGLLLRKRWAEYLVLVATAAFLPLEITELLHHATPLKAGALALNVAIIVYLIWRKRLFLERPGRPTLADDTAPAPP